MTKEEKYASKLAANNKWRRKNTAKSTEYTMKWRNKNKERWTAYNKKWKAENKHRTRGYELKGHYGITLEQYDQMLANQNHSCKICKKHKDLFKGPLVVDHCHETKKIRGLLCTPCNTALGLLKEDPILFVAAMNYLKENK